MTLSQSDTSRKAAALTTAYMRLVSQVAQRAIPVTSFRDFLKFWNFLNRETGTPSRFTELWPGQELFLEATEKHEWLFALKAGKLGFTELECAYDAYRLLTVPNARVHLFSKDQQASYDLLGYVKYGITRLPKEWGVAIVPNLQGGNTARSLKVQIGTTYNDVRTIVSYPATGDVAIDQSATHSHIDELAHIDHAEQMWQSIASTVAPTGTCHIVTRGSGPGYASDLYSLAADGNAGRLHAFFVPYDGRPDHDLRWREQEAAKFTRYGIDHFAPMNEADALAGDTTSLFVAPEWWDSCTDPTVLPITPGDRTPLIIGVDAATTGDCFAIVAVSRHPLRHDEVAVRAVKIWDPQDSGGTVDYSGPEAFIRLIARGGCTAHHPRTLPDPACEYCARGEWTIEPHNVVHIAYDPYQLEDMMQRLRKSSTAWCEQFNQGTDRLKADKALYDAILSRRITHDGDLRLREHVLNAGAKHQKDADSTLRLVKQANNRKIDAAVALSMASYRCKYLNI